MIGVGDTFGGSRTRGLRVANRDSGRVWTEDG